MLHTRDIIRLRRYILLGQFVSLLVFLFGLISLVLFVEPSLIRVPDEQAKLYRNNWVWLATGGVFIIFAGICFLVAGRWSRRLIWIYRNVIPQTMTLLIEIDCDSERTNHYAVLSDKLEETKVKPLWKVALYSPGWNVEELTREPVPAKVYFDPRSLRPAVIETEYGLLWGMAGSGAAEQLTVL